MKVRKTQTISTVVDVNDEGTCCFLTRGSSPEWQQQVIDELEKYNPKSLTVYTGDNSNEGTLEFSIVIRNYKDNPPLVAHVKDKDPAKHAEKIYNKYICMKAAVGLAEVVESLVNEAENEKE